MKSKITAEDWNTLNAALSCASVGVTDKWNSEAHPEWAALVEAGRIVLINSEIVSGEGK